MTISLTLRVKESDPMTAFSMVIAIEEKEFSREFLAKIVSLSVDLATSMQSKADVSLFINETKVL